MENKTGKLIRDLRKAAGMSQMTLADKIGVSYQQVQKYEKGTTDVSVRRLRLLSEIFGVPMSDLIEGYCGNMSNAIGAHLSEEDNRFLHIFRKIPTPLRPDIMAMLAAVARRRR